jgi:hypothetical protein
MMYLNHSRAELKKMSKSKLVSIGTQILKRFPKRALPGTIYVMEQSAKRYGIKSIGKIARKAGKITRKAGRKVKGKFKRAKTARTRSDNGRYGSAIPNKRIGRKYKKYTAKKRKGIHYTKTGQPYKILASGQARFVKR